MVYERFNAPIPVQRDRRNTEMGGIILTKAEAIRWLMETKLGGAMLGDKQVVAVCDMAIAAIREQEERRWIPVTERLPEENGCYIVVACDEGCSAGEGIWYDTVVVEAEYYNCSWSWDENGTEYDLTDIVTHWMPLPEPPKEGPNET